MSFSERNGIIPSKMQYDSMDGDLYRSLWNVFMSFAPSKQCTLLYRHALSDFFKEAMSAYGYYDSTLLDMFQRNFFELQWNRVYDLLEFTCKWCKQHPNQEKIRTIRTRSDGSQIYDLDTSEFVKQCNHVLERESSGWRIVNDIVTQITSDVEINEVEKATHSPLDVVNQHLTHAMTHLYDRNNPAYNNSVKESISAIESICAKITGQKAPVLSDALDKIKNNDGFVLPDPLRLAFEKLYGYTSSEAGIRHAKIRESEVTFELAQFFLVTCSAFVNYLVASSAKSEISLK